MVNLYSLSLALSIHNHQESGQYNLDKVYIHAIPRRLGRPRGVTAAYIYYDMKMLYMYMYIHVYVRVGVACIHCTCTYTLHVAYEVWHWLKYPAVGDLEF